MFEKEAVASHQYSEHQVLTEELSDDRKRKDILWFDNLPMVRTVKDCMVVGYLSNFLLA